MKNFGSRDVDLSQFLFGKNVVVALIDSLATYYRYEEAIEQSHQNNG